jgi:outer membrane protein
MIARSGVLLSILLGCAAFELGAQSPCAGFAPSPSPAADCAARAIPIASVAVLDPNRSYSLTDLIDPAEHNNLRTRSAWERAKQRANELGVENSAYFPVLV